MKMIRVMVAAVVIGGTLALIGGPAGATGGTDCVVEIEGQLPSGEFELSAPTCYSDFADAMTAVGLDGVETPAESATALLSVQSTLAVHFDGANYTGSSLTVSGSSCSGGYINMSATWDNRISSTQGSLCGRIRHYTGVNMTGSTQDTVPSGNLSSPVNNAVSSVQYLT